MLPTREKQTIPSQRKESKSSKTVKKSKKIVSQKSLEESSEEEFTQVFVWGDDSYGQLGIGER